MALLTSILWGSYYASVEQIVKHIDIKTNLIIHYAISLFGFSVWSYFDGSFKEDLTKIQTIMPWMLISSVSTFIAAYCSVAAVKSGGASLASIIEISYPVWVVLFTSIISKKNNFTPNIIFGGLLIFIGTLLVVKSNPQ